MKKAVSSLIVTILLLGFSFAIGAVVKNLGAEYIREEQ